MFLPYAVLDSLTRAQVELWKAHYEGERADQRRPAIEEGIWRRTQDPANAEQSGWSKDASGRRRVVHYRLHYGLDRTQPVERLTLNELYLYVSLLGPADEIDAYCEDVHAWLEAGRWRPDGKGSHRRGDLQVALTEHAVHPQDERADRPTPAGFKSIDVAITSEDYKIERTVRNLPWDVLAGGIRIKEQRGNPEYADDLHGLLDHLPFAVEAGCGTSIEAGIPALHHLHEVYRVTARNGDELTQSYAFNLSPRSDILVKELLTDTERKIDDMVSMFRAMFQAQPTAAHRALKALHDAGHMVGGVATHNFDGLFARVGLDETFMRRYDQRIPHVPLDPAARSLLVIGLHADRREVQRRARERGMKIFYLDTEGVTENGEYKPYPLEGARDGDVVVRSEAVDGLTTLCELLGVSA
ncbi:hypothetical protein ACFYYM_31345 [Streptomyces erythrochromogenes]|uniref:hypothetical protein n=1 Tax=Streptomyces erythrochromogenes TaxID=285574 RepID=UPI0036A8AA5F